MKINITQLENNYEQQNKINFSEIIDEFNKEVPVTAELTINIIDSNYINISGTIKAKVELNCDYCLEKFEKDFDISIDETFARNSLYEEYKDETELKEGSFVEDLKGENELDITDLIYQSVILNIPNKLVCGINCIGQKNLDKYIKKEILDPRLDIFKTIKIEKEKDN